MICFEDVSLRRSGKWLLRNINWKVEKGEHWVLYGLNGAGKTLLLNIINGYYYPTSGKVFVFGKQFGKVNIRDEIRRKIGFVSSSLQERFYKTDTAYDIVLSGAYTSIGLYEEPTEEVKRKGLLLMEQLGCTEFRDRAYHLLSQGEKQRVLIARAMMNDPEILILDEPVNGLDFVVREQVLESIEEIARKENGPAILYVTHHAEEILPVFNKILLLKKGEVYAKGRKEDILQDEILSGFFDLPVEVIWKNGRPLLTKAKRLKTGRD